MAKVYGYGRHSTDKQGLTEGAQRETVETYIRQHLAGVEYGGWLYDSAVSGAEPLFSREQGGRLGTLLEPGDEVVVMTPGYRQIWGTALNMGCTVRELPLNPDNGWRVDLDVLDQVVTPKTKLVAIVNPNNPTGTVMTAA
jgi:hypothetical protein